MYFRHGEFHRMGRIGWLRAAVLGANDGIISTASLLMGVVAAGSTVNALWVIGVAALIAGAMSMAAGEYISVCSQADTEKADIQREQHELETDLPAEKEELTLIYMKQGLERALAATVAEQLMAHDALGAHLRHELGIHPSMRARPLQAALFSAASFSIGALLPILVMMLTPPSYHNYVIFLTAIIALAFLGAWAASMGGASRRVGALRVTLWGTLAMLLTTGIGTLLGHALT